LVLQRQLRTVLCELGCCSHAHAPARYRATEAFARRVARDPDPDIACAAINEAFLRLRGTFGSDKQPKELTNPLGYGRRAVEHAVRDQLTRRRKVRDSEGAGPVEDLTVDLLDHSGSGPTEDDSPAYLLACRRELTRRLYAGGPACQRHPKGCPHPALVFSIAFGILTAALELGEDGVEGFTQPAQQRATVLAVASPSRFTRTGRRYSPAQRKAGQRVRECSQDLLRSVQAGVWGAA
jgi:hypothetical protein